MTDANTETSGESERDSLGPPETDAARSTESYETSDGVVFYDSENPMAWVQADNAIDLDEAA